MERLVYIKSWKTNPNSQIYCVHNTFKKEVEDLFEHFEYRIRIGDFDDNKSTYLSNPDYDVSGTKFWYLVLKKLKDNGYVFSTFVQSRFEWYEIEYLKEQERLNQQRLERQKQKETKEEKPKVQYGWFCNKYDCLTELDFCNNKCVYNTKYNMNCKPEMVKIKKEGI